MKEGILRTDTDKNTVVKNPNWQRQTRWLRSGTRDDWEQIQLVAGWEACTPEPLRHATSYKSESHSSMNPQTLIRYKIICIKAFIAKYVTLSARVDIN